MYIITFQHVIQAKLSWRIDSMYACTITVLFCLKMCWFICDDNQLSLEISSIVMYRNASLRLHIMLLSIECVAMELSRLLLDRVVKCANECVQQQCGSNIHIEIGRHENRTFIAKWNGFLGLNYTFHGTQNPRH